MHPGEGSCALWSADNLQRLCSSHQGNGSALRPADRGVSRTPGQRLLLAVWLRGELVAVQQRLLRAALVPLQLCSCRGVVRVSLPTTALSWSSAPRLPPPSCANAVTGGVRRPRHVHLRKPDTTVPPSTLQAPPLCAPAPAGSGPTAAGQPSV